MLITSECGSGRQERIKRSHGLAQIHSESKARSDCMRLPKSRKKGRREGGRERGRERQGGREGRPKYDLACGILLHKFMK